MLTYLLSTTSAAIITKKCFTRIICRGNLFCNYCKNTLHVARKWSHRDCKNTCFRELFCTHCGQDGALWRCCETWWSETWTRDGNNSWRGVGKPCCIDKPCKPFCSPTSGEFCVLLNLPGPPCGQVCFPASLLKTLRVSASFSKKAKFAPNKQGKGQDRKRGSFGEGVFSKMPIQNRDSRESRYSRDPLECGKQRRIRPFPRESREFRF